jgi:hypothetical protein
MLRPPVKVHDGAEARQVREPSTPTDLVEPVSLQEEYVCWLLGSGSAGEVSGTEYSSDGLQRTVTYYVLRTLHDPSLPG